eukprot:CAMPEP_0172860564 /NCGR_PEP_ID=MMETSP1075-20121228/72162_1 /TAXON_ID=2916 /ORGANISM="Ceratium fusus, Strain PA161109" /LENGTH=242 /DNA_ID=CAMNT_0013708609 /DNA_START=23 /DNA_END=749 /DNA_ORIENTATION=-
MANSPVRSQWWQLTKLLQISTMWASPTVSAERAWAYKTKNNFGTVQSTGNVGSRDNDWESQRFKLGLFWEAEVQLVLRLNRTVAKESEPLKTSIFCSCIGLCKRGCNDDPIQELGPGFAAVSYGESKKVLLAGKMYNAAYIMMNNSFPQGSYQAEATYWSSKKGSNFHTKPGSGDSTNVPVPFIAFMKIDQKVVTSRKSVTWRMETKAGFNHFEENSEHLFQFAVAEDGMSHYTDAALGAFA